MSITTPLQGPQTVEMIKLLGAKPVYIDIDENTLIQLNPINSKLQKQKPF